MLDLIKEDKKVVPKRLSIKDRVTSTKTWNEIFLDDLDYRDFKNTSPRYWKNKYEDLIENMNHKKTK